MFSHNQVRRIKRIVKAFKWAIIISLFIFTESNIEKILPNTNSNKETKVVMASKAHPHSYQLAIVSKKIDKAQYLSNKVRDLIKNSMQRAADKYKLPIILMHAIFKVESDYQYWIKHPTVRVNVDGKRISTNAIGLGGIMWCFWGDSLKANRIAETKSDLYLPDVNVMASAYILRTLINYEEKNNPRLNKSNILNNVVRQYYGRFNRKYIRKMQRFTSKLWMKQVASLLINERTKNDRDHQFAAISMPVKSQSTGPVIAAY